MSHMVTLKSSLTNKDALRKACQALDVPFKEGLHKVALYGGQSVDTDFSFRLKNWNYECAVVRGSGEVKMDNFGGSWGDIKEFDRLNQEYNLQVAENEPSVQEKLAEGWLMERVPQPEGKVRLRVYEPAGAY